jgi:hypothetical protein
MSLGKAFIDVYANTDPFAKDLDAGVEAALADTDKKLAAHGTSGGKAFSENLSKEVEKGAEDVGKDIDKIGKDVDKLAKDTTKSAEDVAKGVEDTGKDVADNVKGFFTGVTDAVQQLPSMVLSGLQQAGTAINSFSTAAAAGLSNVGSGLTAIGIDVADLPVLVIQLALAAAAFVALGIAAGAATGAVIGLVGILGSLSGLLVLIVPFFATLIPIFIVLAPILNEVTTAFGAMNDTAKQFKTASKTMSPIVREMALAFRDINKFLQPLVNTAILQPLIWGFQSIAKVLGPTFRTGLTEVALALADIATSITHVFQSAKTKNDLATMFVTINNVLEKMVPPFVTFVNALLDLAGSAAVQKFFTDAAGFFARLLTSFSTWLDNGIKDGSIAKFLNGTKDTLEHIGSLLKAAGGFFKALITTQTKKLGDSFLDDVTTLINRMTKFLNSKKGQQFITEVGEDLQIVFDIIRVAGPWFVTIINDANKIAKAMYAAGYAVGNLIAKLHILNGTHGAVGQFVSDALKNAPKSSTGKSTSGGVKFNADGAIATSPQMDIWGEAGPEVKIPLTRPARARALAEQSGLTKILGMGGKQSVSVMVSLDGAPFYAYTASAINGAGQALMNGPRVYA